MLLRVALPVLLFAAWIGTTMPVDPPVILSRGADARGERASDPPGPALWSGDIVLERAGDGHFYANVDINGQPVRMLIDTGASLPVLTAADAQRLGLSVSPSEAQIVGRGASGPVVGRRVTLDRVGLGSKVATRVDAVIVTSALPVSLLGQSFLSQICTLTIADDRMVLR